MSFPCEHPSSEDEFELIEDTAPSPTAACWDESAKKQKVVTKKRARVHKERLRTPFDPRTRGVLFTPRLNDGINNDPEESRTMVVPSENDAMQDAHEHAPKLVVYQPQGEYRRFTLSSDESETDEPEFKRGVVLETYQPRPEYNYALNEEEFMETNIYMSPPTSPESGPTRYAHEPRGARAYPNWKSEADPMDDGAPISTTTTNTTSAIVHPTSNMKEEDPLCEPICLPIVALPEDACTQHATASEASSEDSVDETMLLFSARKLIWTFEHVSPNSNEENILLHNARRAVVQFESGGITVEEFNATMLALIHSSDATGHDIECV